MGDVAKLYSGPCAVFYYNGTTDVEVGFTKGGVKLDVTPKSFTLMVDQLGETPANKVLTGVEVKINFALAEFSLENLKLAMANAVPLQDDTTSTKHRVDIRPLAGKSMYDAAKKWTIKPLDNTGQPTTDKNLWITAPKAAPDDATVSLSFMTGEQRTIPVTLVCLPDSAFDDALVIFGDTSVVDVDGSGF